MDAGMLKIGFNMNELNQNYPSLLDRVTLNDFSSGGKKKKQKTFSPTLQRNEK